MRRSKKKRLIKRLYKILLTSSIVCALLAAPYLYYDMEFMELNESSRSIAPGSFVILSDGYTHYQRSENTDSSTIILVHGNLVPNYVWDHVYNSLSDANYDVIRYDLFGRGYSDRPNSDYTYYFFAKQLEELKLALQLNRPVHLVGLAMGSAILARYGTDNPDQVASITLISPISEDISIGTLSWPVIGDYLMALEAHNLPEEQLNDFLYPEKYTDWPDRYRTQMLYSGFRNAILSTLQNTRDTDFNTLYTILSLKEIPIQLIWGKQDKLNPISTIEKIKQMIPLADSYLIENAGHLPNIEQADIVTQMIIEFIKSN